MAASNSVTIEATPEYIETKLAEDVPPQPVTVSMVREGNAVRLTDEDLGFEREEVDDRTTRYRPRQEKYELRPDDEMKLQAVWGRGKDRHQKTDTVRVAQHADAQEGAANGHGAPEQAQFQQESPADTVPWFATACGAVLAVPHAAEADIRILRGDEEVEPGHLGWRVDQVADDAVELVPVSDRATEDPNPVVIVRSEDPDGGRLEQRVQISLKKQPGGPRRSGGARGRGSGFNGLDGGNGGNGRSGGIRGDGETRHGFDPRGFLGAPIHVTSSFGGGGRGGGPGTGETSDWVSRLVRSVLPRLPRRPDPAQFQANVMEFAVRTAGERPSPFVPAQLVATSPAAGIPGFGLPPSDLGGPYAPLRAETDALERIARPAIHDLTPIVDDADMDIVEAEREIALEALGNFIEAARMDVPELAILRTNLDVLDRHFELFATALGVHDAINATSQEDFANRSRYDVVRSRLDAADVVLDRLPEVDSADPRVAIAALEQSLAVVAEKADELEGYLEDLGMGEQERGTIPVQAASTNGAVPPLMLQSLLDLTRQQAGEVLPHILDTSGRLAAEVVEDTLRQISDYVDVLPGFDTFPWIHPLVDQAVSALQAALDNAIVQAHHLAPTPPA
jgi:hypothetical protein